MYTCLLPIKLFIIFENTVWNYIFSFILISILGRSDWPFFCRHVTGSHEDVMWSLWHQFNDVPDFFTVLFHGFPGVFDQHRQRGESECYGFYIHGDLHPREAHIKTTSLSVLLATYSGERRHNLSAETSSPKDMNLWSLGNLGCKDILEVTTLCLKRGVLLDCCSRAKRITMVVVCFAPKDTSLCLCYRSSSSHIRNLFVDYARG